MQSSEENHCAHDLAVGGQPKEKMQGSKRKQSDNDVEDRGQAKKPQHEKSGGAPPKGTKDAKLCNLITALAEVLDEEGSEDLIKAIGKDAVQLCYSLRDHLHHPKVTTKSFFKSTSAAAQSQSFDASNIPRSLSSLSVTPWTVAEIPNKLPPLPKVLDPTLEIAAFTHQGMGTGRAEDLSYERLEWVGDAYLYLTSTLLISQTFPDLTPGKCSQLRERLVKNITLADYAHQYGFRNRTPLPVGVVGNVTKVMGDIFEAYVAAVVLSDPKDGVVRATNWLKKLWSMTLKQEIINGEKGGKKFDSPLWRLRGEVDKVEIVSSAPRQLTAKEALQKLLGFKDIDLTYKEAAPPKKDQKSKLLLFTIGVYLDGYGYKNLQLGYGRANGKKEAGDNAASMALANRSLMKELTDKRNLLLEQYHRELEALERAHD